MSREVEHESLKDEARNIIEEARMILPGIQALFGFQLIAVFNQRFTELSSRLQLLHFAALLLIVLAIALIMTPAAYHRMAERGVVTRRFTTLGSWLIAGAMVPFAFSMSLEGMVIAHIITDNPVVSIAVAGGELLVFSVLWLFLPATARVLGRRRERPNAG